MELTQIKLKCELKKMKLFLINGERMRNRNQREFFETLSEEKNQDDFLTIGQITKEYNKSRKTIYRWRDNGLKVYQKGFKGKILIKRSDLETFLNRKQW